MFFNETNEVYTKSKYYNESLISISCICSNIMHDLLVRNLENNKFLHFQTISNNKLTLKPRKDVS